MFAISTLATQIMVLPILSYSIGAVSIVALIANMLVLPLVPLAMFLSGLAGFVYLVFPPFGIIVGYPAHVVLSLIIYIGDWFGRLPFSAVALPPFSFIWVVVGYMFIGSVLWYVVAKKNPRPKHVVLDEEIFPF